MSSCETISYGIGFQVPAPDDLTEDQVKAFQAFILNRADLIRTAPMLRDYQTLLQYAENDDTETMMHMASDFGCANHPYEALLDILYAETQIHLNLLLDNATLISGDWIYHLMFIHPAIWDATDKEKALAPDSLNRLLLNIADELGLKNIEIDNELESRFYG